LDPHSPRRFAVFALPASGQELAAKVLDIEFRVIDLGLRTIDLVLEGTDVDGAVKELAVEETETEIRIELSADVLFDFDKSDIKDDAAAALTQVASMIRDHAGRPVRIRGDGLSRVCGPFNQSLGAPSDDVRVWRFPEVAPTRPTSGDQPKADSRQPSRYVFMSSLPSGFFLSSLLPKTLARSLCAPSTALISL
jgi:hypothetical protein